MKAEEFAERVRAAGGAAYLVGGFVRDFVRGESPKDRDYVLTGMTEAKFFEMFPEGKKIGKSFPVYQLEIDGLFSEVSFARREWKAGMGYLGFSVEYDPEVDLEEDLHRRDTTMNSMAMSIPEGKIIDLYGGRDDIAAGCIRAVSRRFLEDPVRSLRAARQAALFGYTVEAGTIALMKETKDELLSEPTERIFGEFVRAMGASKPSVFFEILRAAELLDAIFPEIFALIGKTQPEKYHPEGDAYVHTMLVLDEVSKNTENILTRFAALTHDLGKGRTPSDMLPHHYGHDKEGLVALSAWDRRMRLPMRYKKAATFVIKEHMRAPTVTKVSKKVEILLAAEKSVLGLEEFNKVIAADHHDLPLYLKHGKEYLVAIQKVSGSDAPKSYKGEEIAAWVRGEQQKVFQKLRNKLEGSSEENV